MTQNPETRDLATGLEFPEGPVVMDDGSVLVVEIHRATLSRIPAGGGTAGMLPVFVVVIAVRGQTLTGRVKLPLSFSFPRFLSCCKLPALLLSLL